MPVYEYAVLRLVPSSIRGERFNVGIVVVGEDPPFLQSRVIGKSGLPRLARRAGLADLAFLLDLAVDLESSAVSEHQLDVASGPWTRLGVIRASREWANLVQLSDLHPVEHADPQKLVDELFTEYVAPRPRAPRGFRDKRWVKGKVRTALRGAIVDSHGIELKPQARAQGQFEEHTFDFGLLNGRALGLIQTLSFEVPERAPLKLEIDATAWAIDDLRKADTGIPITVVTIGEHQSRLLETASRIYSALGADVIVEEGLESWLDAAPAMVSQLVASA